MPVHQETKVLPYRAAQMYALVADVASYPQFHPWCSGARILSREDNEMLAELTIGYKVIRERFVSRVLLNKTNKTIEVAYVSGPLKALRNEWKFHDTGPGQCQVDFFVHFEFSSRLLSHLMDVFFDVAFRRMVTAFEKRAEEIYGSHKGRL